MKYYKPKRIFPFIKFEPHNSFILLLIFSLLRIHFVYMYIKIQDFRICVCNTSISNKMQVIVIFHFVVQSADCKANL